MSGMSDPHAGPAAALPAPLIPQTPRLLLRHPQAQDLDALAALYGDTELRKYFPDGTLTRAETAQELAWFRHGHPRRPELGLWTTVERSTGALLGRCGLLPWTIEGRDEVELAYLIDKARWGEGFATEAAQAIVQHAGQELGLHRLICLIAPGNVASMRVARKVGMAFERELVDELGLCHIFSRSL